MDPIYRHAGSPGRPEHGHSRFRCAGPLLPSSASVKPRGNESDRVVPRVMRKLSSYREPRRARRTAALLLAIMVTFIGSAAGTMASPVMQTLHEFHRGLSSPRGALVEDSDG